jgi:iron(III) transport system permease protein
VRYGLMSAMFVVFTLVVTDFGIAKVIGGQFNVLATDAYKAGDRPAELRDGRGGRVRAAGAGRGRLLSSTGRSSDARSRCSRRGPCRSSRDASAGKDAPFTIYCLVVGGLIAAVLGVAVWASFITYGRTICR